MNYLCFYLKPFVITFLYFLATLFTIDFSMKFIVFALTVGYTIRRWYLLEKNKKDE